MAGKEKDEGFFASHIQLSPHSFGTVQHPTLELMRMLRSSMRNAIQCLRMNKYKQKYVWSFWIFNISTYKASGWMSVNS